jgi:hypothetical protein
MMSSPQHGSGPRPAAIRRALLACWLAGATTCAAWAAAPGKKVQLPGPADVTPVVKSIKEAKPADFKSAHFLIHTDLSSKEAHELLNRLEVMLGLISKYWAQKPVGTIECYVVKDLRHWPEGAIDPAGRAKIQEGAGVTLVDTLTRGNKTIAAKAVVYATADHGTPQHEAVHAYCGQTFGRTGPLWYSEGMAELGQYWHADDMRSVHCPDYVVQYIRSERPKPLSEILSEDGVQRPGRPAAKSGDSWQNYAWRWALCHLLANNTNYNARFRPLGLGYLTGQRVSFADSYASMLAEIAFEYRFFVRHLDVGYRVDLCSWDWKHRFRELAGAASASTHVVAWRGWQPSGVIVESGKHYDYSASGMWRTAKDGADVTADGASTNAGRLEGVIFKDFALSEPFPLGAYGSFTPPSSGQLFLRCGDRWNELGDNKGAMTVKIKNAGEGPPLARPGRKSEEPPASESPPEGE